MKKSFVFVLSLLLAACSRSEFDQIRHEFLAGCTSSGASDSQCKCSFEKLQTKYPPEAMIAINRQGTPPDGFADDLVQAQMLCMTGSSQPLRRVAVAAAASQSDDANSSGVLTDKEAMLRDKAQAATDPAPASPQESLEMAKAEYKANWGESMPEETLGDIRHRYESTDFILNKAYKDAMGRLELTSQQQLKVRQRGWLKERDQACGTTDGQAADMAGYTCLIKEVDQRIRVIENLH